MKAEAGSARTPARVLAGALQNSGPVRGWSLGVGDDIGYALLVASLGALPQKFQNGTSRRDSSATKTCYVSPIIIDYHRMQTMCLHFASSSAFPLVRITEQPPSAKEARKVSRLFRDEAGLTPLPAASLLRVRASPGHDKSQQSESRGGCAHASAQGRRRAGSRVMPQDGGGGDLLPAAGPERYDSAKLAPRRQMFRGADLADRGEGHAHRPGNRCGAESARMGGAPARPPVFRYPPCPGSLQWPPVFQGPGPRTPFSPCSRQATPAGSPPWSVGRGRGELAAEYPVGPPFRWRSSCAFVAQTN